MKHVLPFLYGLTFLIFCGLVIWAMVPRGGETDAPETTLPTIQAAQGTAQFPYWWNMSCPQIRRERDRAMRDCARDELECGRVTFLQDALQEHCD